MATAIVAALTTIGTTVSLGGLSGTGAAIAGGLSVVGSAASLGTTLASAAGAFNPDIPKPQAQVVAIDQAQEAKRRAAGIGQAGRAGTVLTSGRGLADDTLVASRPRLLGESTGSPS